MDTQRALIITHSYSPVVNPRAFRWTAVAEVWAGRGLKVDIVCAWHPGLERIDQINGVDIYRVGGGLSEKIRQGWRQTKAAPANPESSPRINGSFRNDTGKISRLAKRVHDLTWKKLYWPDYACLWFWPARQKTLDLLRRRYYKFAISVSDPFTGHLVGEYIKREHPALPWMVDIGDPFAFRHDTPTNNHELYRNLNYRVERRIFARADFITVTCAQTLQKYRELFPESATKLSVVPPLMPPVESPLAVSADRAPDGKIKLLFLGTLYKAIRNPDFLLRLFAELLQTDLGQRLELHFYGGVDDCREFFQPYHGLLNSRIFVWGLVDRRQALQAISEADILVNISNDNPYQLPSKIVEYAWTGKPIVNLCRLENDTSADFLREYPSLLNIQQSGPGPQPAHVESFYRFIKQGMRPVGRDFLANWRKRFSPESISAIYETILGVKQNEARLAHLLRH